MQRSNVLALSDLISFAETATLSQLPRDAPITSLLYKIISLNLKLHEAIVLAEVRLCLMQDN